MTSSPGTSWWWVGLIEDDFGSLTPEQMEKFEKLFHAPEAFVKMGHGLIVLPIDDRTVKSAAKEEVADAVKRTQPGHDVLCPPFFRTGGRG